LPIAFPKADSEFAGAGTLALELAGAFALEGGLSSTSPESAERLFFPIAEIGTVSIPRQRESTQLMKMLELRLLWVSSQQHATTTPHLKFVCVCHGSSPISK